MSKKRRKLRPWVYFVVVNFILISLLVTTIRTLNRPATPAQGANQAIEINYFPAQEAPSRNMRISAVEVYAGELDISKESETNYNKEDIVVVSEKEYRAKQKKKKEYNGLSKSEFELLCAIVRQEAGPSYDSALAVMTSLNNRLNDPRWNWCGDTIMEQATAPGQYCYDIDDYWVKYLDGNVEDCIISAVKDGLDGIVNHEYNSFRGYYVEDALEIGGNWYFNSW